MDGKKRRLTSTRYADGGEEGGVDEKKGRKRRGQKRGKRKRAKTHTHES